MVLWKWKRPKFSSKRSYFISQKSIEISPSTKTLTNFYLTSSWQSLLTAIWFSRLKISHWFLSGSFCWTRDQRNIEPRIKKQQAFFEICFLLTKIRTTNIGKGWRNRNHGKISGQNQTFLKKKILEKYCQAHFVRTFLKRVYDCLLRNFRFPSFTGQKMLESLKYKCHLKERLYFTPYRSNFVKIFNRSIFSKFIKNIPSHKPKAKKAPGASRSDWPKRNAEAAPSEGAARNSSAALFSTIHDFLQKAV